MLKLRSRFGRENLQATKESCLDTSSIFCTISAVQPLNIKLLYRKISIYNYASEKRASKALDFSGIFGINWRLLVLKV